MGVYADDGELMYIVRHKRTPKPLPSSGATSDLVRRVIIEGAAAGALSIVVDPNVIVATQQWCFDTFGKAAIMAPLTINVPGAVVVDGVEQPVDSIQDAWDLLNGAKITAPVTIQVADGTYTASHLRLTDSPYAHQIRILGNGRHPWVAVVFYLRWAPRLPSRHRMPLASAA